MTTNVGPVESYGVGDGVSTSFGTTFPFISAADLQVGLVTGGSEVSVAFTVTGGNFAPGSVVLSVPPALSVLVHMRRRTNPSQLTDYISNDGFPADATERGLDKLTYLSQEFNARIGALEAGAVVEGLSVANLGSGAGVLEGVIGGQVRGKTLVAGAGITMTPSATEILIAASVGGAALQIAQNLADLSNVATARANLGLGTMALAAATDYMTKAANLSDVAARQTSLNNLTAVGAATNEYVLTKDTGTGNVLWKPVPGGGGGEANTISQAGAAGVSILQATPKVGIDLRTRGLIAGANIAIAPTGTTDVTISGTGEANAGANVGIGGTGWYSGKLGLNLQFKGAAIGLGLTQSVNATDVTHALDLTATLPWVAKHTNIRTVGDKPDVLLGLQSLNGGAMPHLGSSIMLTSGYRTPFDVQKTSLNTDSPTGNSTAGYIQHYVSGVVGVGARLFAGLRVQAQSDASGVEHELVGVYSGVKLASASSSAAWGFFTDTYHDSANAGSASRGFATEVFRTNSAGKVWGFQAQIANGSTSPSDVGFVVSQQSGGAPRWLVGFSVGGVGTTGIADVGFDASLGTVNTAAFRMTTGQKFRMAGASSIADLQWTTTSGVFGGTDQAIEFINGANPTFAIRQADAVLGFKTTTRTLVGAAGGATALPATPLAYMPIFFKHPATGLQVVGQIPIYNF